MRGLATCALLLALALAGPGTAQAAQAHSKESTATYSALDTLTATVVHDDGTRGVLSVQAGLDVPDARMRKFTTQSIPRLRDAYVRVLTIYASGLAPGAPPNVDQIAQQMQNATDRTLGKPGAHLLIGTVLVN
jgi:hypothetical protein